VLRCCCQAVVLGEQPLAEVETHAGPKLLRGSRAQQQEGVLPHLLLDGLQKGRGKAWGSRCLRQQARITAFRCDSALQAWHFEQ
jgi:hypothetical protein